TVASDGRAALMAMGDEKFHLIISDIIMPGMGGYDLCRRIREISQIPVVLVTQLFDPEDIVRGLASGADGFIIKPFDPASLLNTVSDMLDEEGAAKVIEDGDLIIAAPNDQTYTITASRKTILRILLSTYATAVNKNMELQEARDELYGVNEQLQEFVEELQQTNDDLSHEVQERQRMERELLDAHRKLKLMTSITHHDIKNQLTVIEGYLELAASNEGAITTQEAITKTREAGRRIERIIELTRDFQEIGTCEPEWLDFTSLVDRARRMVDLKGVSIITETPGLEVYAEPLLEKVIANIIENSIRHGERVTTIRITMETYSDFLLIHIRDDGVGIPEYNKRRIFEQGFGRNTGIGLFLTSKILETSGFAIRECGGADGGACFEIRVPKGLYNLR
ncbi:hybrid sensor histidine kinase/response regulator, partial [Methanocalculus sp.]|uniref:hybrid sensor histidine kinase/response regulator n=1 Tax=Methanocalculus sp. TaxID=2004547 RepID=UPI00271E5AA4